VTYPLVRLDECARIVSGATPSTSKTEFWDGDIRWVTPADLSNLDGPFISETPRTITEAGLANCAAEILPAYSVLFSSRAPIGHVAINTAPMATNQGFKSFIPSPNRLDAAYLYHWLRANRKYLESQGNGATFKEVSKSVVARIEIPLPPIDEQRRIATILDQAEDLRRKRREALRKIELLGGLIFVEMFGEPLSSNGKWPTEELGKISSFENGDRSSKYPSGEDILESGIPFLSTKNIINDSLDLSVLNYISPEKFASLSRGKARPQDLIITLRGTLGSCCIFEGETQTAFINAQMMIIRLGPTVLPSFLHAFLTLPSVKAHLVWIGNGAAVPQLTSNQLSKLIIPIPPLNLQRAFAARVAEIDALKARHRAQLAKLDALFAALKYRAFKGDL
jgi:type I restriction enzyme, S subunit